MKKVDHIREDVQHRKKMLRGYLADLSYFYDLPKWANEILYELLSQMDSNGQIIVNMGLKKSIAAELKISVASIKNAISIYHKKQILMRQDEGIYLAHPVLFGKGEWNKVHDCTMEVSYNEEGIRVIDINFLKN